MIHLRVYKNIIVFGLVDCEHNEEMKNARKEEKKRKEYEYTKTLLLYE